MQDTDQVTSDLLWVVESPPLLVDAVPAGQLPEGLLSAGLGEVFDWKPIRQVGRYFERLVEYWLLEVRGVEMIRKGFQVMEGNRTLGELDFVFRDESGILTHWEVAVKFYLFFEGEFVGPNGEDTLSGKVARVSGHQLPLGRSAFPEIGQSGCFFKGCLYYHPGEAGEVDLPGFVNPGHQRGTWLRASELDWFGDGREYYLLEKPHWFTLPVGGDTLIGQDARDQLALHFKTSNRPVHLMDSEGQSVFVVGEDWPG